MSNKPNTQEWDKLREEFFNECTDVKQGCDVPGMLTEDIPVILRQVNLALHDLFEWFKSKLSSQGITPPEAQPVSVSEEDYESFSKEWESELMKVKKADLIFFYKRALLWNRELSPTQPTNVDECVNCDKYKPTHHICGDCLNKLINENKTKADEGVSESKIFEIIQAKFPDYNVPYCTEAAEAIAKLKNKED